MTHPHPSNSHTPRRHQVVADSLANKLSEAELEQALKICEEDFDTDADFSAAEFCQRLTSSLPDTQLGKKTRLLILHNVRDPVETVPSPYPSSPECTSPQVPSTSPHPSAADNRPISDPQSQRKRVHCPGVYWCHGSDRSGALVVANLSEAGTRLQLITPSDLQRGDTLQLHFAWEDSDHPIIRLETRVTWAIQDTVSTEFLQRSMLPPGLIESIRS